MFTILHILFVILCAVPFIVTGIRHAIRSSDSYSYSLDDDLKKWYIRSVVIFVLGILVMIALNILVDIGVKSLWFESKGYLDIYLTILGTQWGLYFAGVGVCFALTFPVFYSIVRINKDKEERHTGMILAISLVVSALMGIWTSGMWNSVLLAQNQVTSEILDPVFNLPINYYFFTLPLLGSILWWFIVVALIDIAFVITAYSIFAYDEGIEDTNGSGLIFAIGGVISVLIALSLNLAVKSLVFSTSGVVVGAGYTDLHNTKLMLGIMQGVFYTSGALLILSAFKPLRRLIFLADSDGEYNGRAVIFPGVFLVFCFAWLIVPFWQQQFEVKPSEKIIESPYIQRNIDNTLVAYGLDKVIKQEVEVEEAITQEILAANTDTLENIRLWDGRALMTLLAQNQEIRPYYEFEDIDVDRYMVDGKYREVWVAARELEFDQLDDRAKTWVNKTFGYTHGYGMTMVPINEFASNGEPVYFMNNIPAQSSSIDLTLARPEIYYGERTTTTVLTNGLDVTEFDYPSGEENVYTTYEGDGGFLLDTAFKRFIVAWKMNDWKIFISAHISEETRVHMNRQIMDMVGTIAPFFTYGSDPYPIINAEGGITQIIDGYTLSDNYPYSERYSFAGKYINYIRNSVKVEIDAYDGDVTFYLFDEDDIIAQTYAKIFPTLFTPASAMSDDVRAHLRVPEDYQVVLAQVYRTYHMTNVDTFFGGEDKWDIAKEKYWQGSEREVDPYYIMMKFPEEESHEFVSITPFVPKNKNVLISWMSFRNDGEHYGEIVVFTFQKGKNFSGPYQIEARIDSDTEHGISDKLSLWNQQGSTVIRGNLLVLPLFHEGKVSLLYVEPIYVQGDSAPMPEIARVVVADQNEILWAETFEKALRALTHDPGNFSYSITELEDVAIGSTDATAIVQAMKAAFSNYESLTAEGKYVQAAQELESVRQYVYQLSEMLNTEE